MVVLADNQDITRAGMMHVCDSLGDMPYRQAADKTELIEQLKIYGDAVVVLDFTVFDINDIDELEILYERFPSVRWILFSFDLSSDFVRRAIAELHYTEGRHDPVHRSRGSRNRSGQNRRIQFHG